jgi:proteasome accessory factor C
VSSPRTAERLSRLLSMLPWALEHPGSSVEELSRRFGYEGAELLRDLNLIFVCGLPGYGPGDLMDMTIDDGEVYIDLADYFSKPLRLSAPEALMVLAAGSALLSSGTAPPALHTAVDKLRRLITVDDGVFEVDLDPEPELIGVLRDAASLGRVVSITHTSMSSGRTTERNIEPWGVFTTQGNWYVTGHCRLAGAERAFRVDRIRDVTVTDEQFTPPAETPDPHVTYTPGADDVTATIRLAPEAAWVSDYYPVAITDTTHDGSMVIDFSTADPLVAARLLLRLGDTAVLVGGPEVEAALEDLRSRILARYR